MDDVLWDVMDEHLDESAYLCEELETQLDRSTLSLAQVEDGIEQRLLAHADALVVGGDVVAQQLLAAELAPDHDPPPEPPRATAIAFALALGQQRKLLAAGLWHSDAAVRRASVRGIELAGPRARGTHLEAWAIDRFHAQRSPEERAVVLPLAAARLEPAVLLECLQSEHAELVAAAARVVARGPADGFTAAVERLLDHPREDVRRHALRAGLAWGSPHAWAECKQRAFVREPPEADSLTLYAALCAPAQHERLVELDASFALLFALGFTGNPSVLPMLLAHVGGKDELLAKVAAQSVALITGLDFQDDAYTLPEQPEDPLEEASALPDLQDDDLDADLVPPPEAALARPNADAIGAFWEQTRGAFSPGQRYLLGRPITPASLLDALERAKMRMRHGLASALGIRTGGHAWLDTRALVCDQRARIAALRTLPLRFVS
jgi:uncharacterized protein (TIGR02270 family)